MRNALVFLVAFAVVVGGGMAAFALAQGAAAPASGGGVAVLPPAQPVQRQFGLALVMYGMGSNETHRWTPGVITARVGDTVTLKVKNADLDCPDDPHGFALPAFGIDLPEIAAGQEETVTFKVTKAGIFDFKCAKEKCAKDHDLQLGQLVVFQ